MYKQRHSDFLTYFPQAYAYAPGQRLERSTATACWDVSVEDKLRLQGGVLNISEKKQTQYK